MKCETCNKRYTDKDNKNAIKDIGECISCQFKREEDQDNFQMSQSD